MHFRPDHRAGIYSPFYFKVGERSDAPGRADSCNAESKIKSREADSHVRVDRRAAAHREKHMIVHPDKPRQDGVSGEIERFGGRRNRHRCARTDGLDLTVSNKDRLILLRRGANAVDYTDMKQGDQRSFDSYELLAFILRTLSE